MDEARIKALYRRHSRRPAPLQDGAADDICRVLQRTDWPAEQETALDRVAGSALEADIARLVAGLDQDISTLSREIEAVRKPRQRPIGQRLARSGLALAAGVGAIALGLSLFQGAQQSLPATAGDADIIMALSFEEAEPIAAAQTTETDGLIFGGDFDS